MIERVREYLDQGNVDPWADPSVGDLSDYHDPYDDIPAEYRPRNYGRRIIREVRLGDIIMLDQVRQHANSEHSKIAESIEAKDLINIPEVAVLDEDHFREYLNIVHFRRYKGHAPDEEFAKYTPDRDGLYSVVISGHTRTRSMIDNETDRSLRAREMGYETNPLDATTRVNAMFNIEPEEIIARQIEENFHSSPPPESLALVTVSHYQYLKFTGKVKTQEDYVRYITERQPKQKGDNVGLEDLDARESRNTFSKSILAGMLAYSRLPESTHAIVSERGLPYSVAIELSKLQPRKLLELGLSLYGVDYLKHIGAIRTTEGSDDPHEPMSGEELVEIDRAVEIWIAKQANFLYGRHLRNSRFGITQQKAHIKQMSGDIEKAIKDMLNYDQSLVEELTKSERMVGGMRDGNIHAKSMIQQLQRDLRSIMEQLTQDPVEKIDRVVDVDRALAGVAVGDVQMMREERKALLRVKLAQLLGIKAEELDSMKKFLEMRRSTGDVEGATEDQLHQTDMPLF